MAITIIQRAMELAALRKEKAKKEFTVRPAFIDFEIDKVNPDISATSKFHCFNCGTEGDVLPAQTNCCPHCGTSFIPWKSMGNIYTYVDWDRTVENPTEFMVLEMSVSVTEISLEKCDLDFELIDVMWFHDNKLDNWVISFDEWTKKTISRSYYWHKYSGEFWINLTAKDNEELIQKFGPIVKSRYFRYGYNNKNQTVFDDKNYLYLMKENYMEAVKNGQIKKQHRENKEVIPEIPVHFVPKEFANSQFPEEFTEFKSEKVGLVSTYKCLHCGKTFATSSYVSSCPHCGASTSHGSRVFRAYSCKLIPDEGIAVYNYYENPDYVETIDAEGFFVKKYAFNGDIAPKTAFLVTNGKTYYYKISDNKMVPCPCADIRDNFTPSRWGYFSERSYYPSVQEYVNTILDSPMEKKGVVFYAKSHFKEGYYFQPSTEEDFGIMAKYLSQSINLLNMLNNIPCVEYLAKANLPRFMDAMMYSATPPKFINKKGTNVCEVLRLNKDQLKQVRAIDANPEEIESYLEFLALDPNATVQDAIRFIRSTRAKEIALDILKMEIPKINVKEMNTYADHMYNNQCMSWEAGMADWRDYLRMVKEMKYDMNDRDVLFTRSLMLDHCRAVRKYESICNHEVNLSFLNAVEAYKDLEYDDKEQDFIVKVPKDQEELYEEGRLLHHCVGSYVNSVSSGNSIIVFIRDKSCPEKPLVTVEIRNKQITQYRTKFNASAYSVPGMSKFIHHWAKEKKLTISYQC